MVVGVSAGDGRVPPLLPPLLKHYTKAAIRTQPRDIIAWSHAYFSALSDGVDPPVKEQLEFPLPETESGVSPGLLRVMHRKFHAVDAVYFDDYSDLCQAMGVEKWAIQGAWDKAEDDEKDVRHWDNLMVALVNQTDESLESKLNTVLSTVPEDLTSKKVPVDEVVSYLKLLRPVGDLDDIIEYLHDVASYQDGVIIPADLSRPLCPIKDHD